MRYEAGNSTTTSDTFTCENLKKLFTLLDLCVSSLRRGHANLLCIVPILTDDPKVSDKHGMRFRAITRSNFENASRGIALGEGFHAHCIFLKNFLLEKFFLVVY